LWKLYSKLISKLVSNEIHMKFELQVLYVLTSLKRIVSSKMICSLIYIFCWNLRKKRWFAEAKTFILIINLNLKPWLADIIYTKYRNSEHLDFC
jgi:hypothetical protein